MLLRSELMGLGKVEFRSVNKAVVLVLDPVSSSFFVGNGSSLLFLVGRGGGRKEKSSSVASRREMRGRGSVESAPAAAASKQRHVFAAAISGHGNGPAALELVCLRIFNLHRRNLQGLVASVQVRVPPSGAVPGGSKDGCGELPVFVGGEPVLDRVFPTLSRVLRAKFTDCAVIYSFFMVLLVILYPPPYKCRL
jgi:hypothetical protein